MRKLDKYATLQLLLAQLGWAVLPPIIITVKIKGTILNATIKHLQYLHILTFKIHKLMETFTQIAIQYLYSHYP